MWNHRYSKADYLVNLTKSQIIQQEFWNNKVKQIGKFKHIINFEVSEKHKNIISNLTH